MIGFLTGPGGAITTPDYEAFREGLRELGYVEGRSIKIEFRGSNTEELATAVSALDQLPVTVLVTVGSSWTLAAREATSTIPIVQAVGHDLVEAGLAASLARPSGNVTGLTNISAELNGKRLELLHDVLAGAPRVAVLWNASHPTKARELADTQSAAETLGLQIQSLPVRAADDFVGAFESATRAPAHALMVLEDGLVHPRPQLTRLAELAAQSRLPSIYPDKSFAEVGGLMAYGPNRDASVRRAATYVDKILKGAKPADLPIERPMRFDFVINLRTAQALGLTIPQHVLYQATEVIQ
jgi:putative ABC transport system substrate-binding protein